MVNWLPCSISINSIAQPSITLTVDQPPSTMFISCQLLTNSSFMVDFTLMSWWFLISSHRHNPHNHWPFAGLHSLNNHDWSSLTSPARYFPVMFIFSTRQLRNRAALLCIAKRWPRWLVITRINQPSLLTIAHSFWPFLLFFCSAWTMMVLVAFPHYFFLPLLFSIIGCNFLTWFLLIGWLKHQDVIV